MIDGEKDEILWRHPSSDFFSLKGLSTRTGCSEDRLDVAVKELLDNALDECDGEDPPFVTAKVRDCGNFLSVKGGNNGSRIGESGAEKLSVTLSYVRLSHQSKLWRKSRI